MSTAVVSFSQYRARIRDLLSGITPLEGVGFCLWCGSRLSQEFGDYVWDGLTAHERTRLETVFSALRQASAGGQLLDSKDARAFQSEVLAFGPHGEAATEVHSDGVEFRSLVWQALEYSCTRDVSALCAASETLINGWDYRIAPEAADYELENMFTFPELQRELAVQEEYLGRIRGSSRPTRG